MMQMLKCSQQSAKVDGYITEVAVQDNQAVYRGDMAKLHLDYTLITAPIAGIVGNRRSRSGGLTPFWRIDLRWLLMFGLACFAFSMWTYLPLPIKNN